MKKLKKSKLIFMTVCAAMLIALPAYAYTDNDFYDLEMKSADGIYTVITDTEGIEHTYDGAINPQTIETSSAVEKIASYKVYADNKEIISVKLNDVVSKRDVGLFSVAGTPVSNGYYSVKFQLSEEENTEAYLTGLSETNLDMVQEELISATLENSEFDIESLDFIDAEKTNISDDSDNELCWAASASNMLHYTGWGQQAGFNTADDLFDMFNENFTDAPGNAYFGTEWFFNKINQMQEQEGWAQVKNYGKSGGFLLQYSADVLRDYISVKNNHKNIKDVIKALERGCGVGITIGWIDENGARNGGHAITMWGYIIDKDFGENDSNRYTNTVISDSDSDMPFDENRRIAPNKLKVLNMQPYTEYRYDSWKTEGYNNGVLEAFAILKPYSDDIEYETDDTATRDKFNSTDFMIDGIYASNDALDFGVSLNAFSLSDNIYIVPNITNLGKDFDGTIKYNVTVTKKDDSIEIFNKDYEYSGEIAQFMEADKNRIPKSDIGQYETGEYMVKISLNTDKAVDEAYYYNNTKTYGFTVKNAEYDLSSAKINAQIGEFKDGTAKAQITYEGLQDITLPQNAEYELLQSYYENGTWGEWETANTGDTEAVGGISLMADDMSILPEQCTVYARGTKVKFRLVIGVEDENEPVLNVYSDECDLQYKKVNIKADESNPTELAPLEQGENTLKNNETLKFKMVNASTDNNRALTCDAAVIAVNSATDETVKLYEQKNISVGYGEESDTISFNSWDSGVILSGTYKLYAIIDGGYGDVGVELGELKVKEIPNCLVTTHLDITDEYDGLISLREAVNYCNETEIITFSGDFSTVGISVPIVIDKAVTVNGMFEDETAEDIPALGTALFAANKCQIFKVVKNGSLNLHRLTLMYGKSEEYGGAVEVDGGDAELNECRIFNCSSGISGGGIYAKGGNVTLKNCSFKLNKSGYGGAAGIGKDAQANMINCTLFQNTSNSGAVYNNGGDLTAVYSTFVDNTASSSGGSNITSLGNTNLVGCIAADDERVSLGGNIDVFGSYIGECDNYVTVTDCENGTKKEMFKLEGNSTASWHTEGDGYRVLHYLPYLTHNAKNGVDVKNKDGKITYRKADGEEKTTEITSPFTDEEYALDALGNAHNKYYGSYCLSHDITELIFTGGGLSVYTPEARDAELITAYYDENNALIKTDIQPLSLAAGTSGIDVLSDTPDGAAGVKYMLWDGVNTMRPIADALDMPIY